MKPSPQPRRRVAVLVMGIVLAVVGAANLSFTSITLPGNVWTQLGISETVGAENIRKTFLEGYLYTYGSGAARKLAVGDRVAVAHDVLVYTKSYVSTPEFQQAYEQAREQHRPTPPASPKNMEQVRAEQVAALEKSIEETEKSINTLSADMQESMKEVVKSFREQLAEYKNPENEMIKYMAEAEKFNHEAAMQNYETSLANWQKAYPERYQLMIKDRLQTFLALTADVDYNAAVHEQYGLKKFNNIAYERKPAEWKMAYRAGKPVVDAAREFASAWMKELR